MNAARMKKREATLALLREADVLALFDTAIADLAGKEES